MFATIKLIIIVLCQQFVYCLAKPLNNSSNDSNDVTDNSWINRLMINLVGYSLILVPSAIVVFLVKNQLCFNYVRDNSLIKLFVYGNVNNCEYNHNNDETEDKLLPISDNISKDSIKSQTRIQNISVLFYCFFGLQLSYLSWGLLQEKIMTTHYQIDGNYLVDQNRFVVSENVVTLSSFRQLNGVIEAIGDKGIIEESNEMNTKANQLYYIRFKNSQFIVLVNRLLAFIVAFSVILIKNRQKRHTVWNGNEAPLYQYIYCSLSNVLSSWCQYEALKYVSFPTQVLSKACKLLPVMLMSQIIGDKKYRTIEYLFAITISLGMTMFLWSDHQTNSHHKNVDTTNVITRNYSGGLIILILYLTFDSFTSNWQGIMFERYKVSTFQMMASVNLFSIMLTLTSLTQQGDLIPAFQLVFHNYNLFRDCFLLSLFSATGQLFVFYTISNFGALIFVTIMTLRQAFAILLSCLIYSHSLALMGIIGVLIVFFALFAQIYWKSKNKGKR